MESKTLLILKVMYPGDARTMPLVCLRAERFGKWNYLSFIGCDYFKRKMFEN